MERCLSCVRGPDRGAPCAALCLCCLLFSSPVLRPSFFLSPFPRLSISTSATLPSAGAQTRGDGTGRDLNKCARCRGSARDPEASLSKESPPPPTPVRHFLYSHLSCLSLSASHFLITPKVGHHTSSKLWFFPCRKSAICCHYPTSTYLLLLSPPSFFLIPFKQSASPLMSIIRQRGDNRW